MKTEEKKQIANEKLIEVSKDMLNALIKIKEILLLPESERPSCWSRSFLQGYGGDAINKALK